MKMTMKTFLPLLHRTKKQAKVFIYLIDISDCSN